MVLWPASFPPHFVRRNMPPKPDEVKTLVVKWPIQQATSPEHQIPEHVVLVRQGAGRTVSLRRGSNNGWLPPVRVRSLPSVARKARKCRSTAKSIQPSQSRTDRRVTGKPCALPQPPSLRSPKTLAALPKSESKTPQDF